MQTVELLDLEDVASICNHCGKEDIDLEAVNFCHNCLQVAFCSVECAKKAYDEHKNYCTALTPETADGLIGPRMRGGRPGGRPGGGRPGGSRPGGARPGGMRPGGVRPRMRPAGGWRPYRPGRGRPGPGGSRWFGGRRAPWRMGFFNPFWYSAYSLWYPRYWTPNFAYAGVLPVLPAIVDMTNQAAINATLMALRADPRYAIPGAAIVPDPETGRFIYVGV